MAAVVTTKLDEKGILALYTTPRSPVASHVNRIANTTVKLSKKYVGKDSHALQRSIRKGILHVSPDGVVIQVGSLKKYAEVHHEGSTKKNYPIRPIPPNRYLRFKVGGKFVTIHQVTHPGVKPNRYLTKALREAVLGAPATR